MSTMLALYNARVILSVWDVEYTDQFEQWWNGLSIDEQAAIDVAVEVLQEKGPGLGRPLVDIVQASRHSNMKELRPRGGSSASCLPSTRCARLSS